MSARQYHKRNSEPGYDRARAWQKRNPDKVRLAKASWCKLNPDKKRSYDRNYRLKQFGITVSDYDSILKSQGGKCAICGNPPGKKFLDVDHCHDSKKVRGLLCNNCNRGIGHFQENLTNLVNAVDYLAAVAA